MQNRDYSYPEKRTLVGHPMYEHISFSTCAKESCSKENIFITDAGYSVHPHSGDAYGEYTVHCAKCGKTESKSFSDN